MKRIMVSAAVVLCALGAARAQAPVPPPALPAPAIIQADAKYDASSPDVDYLFRLGMLEGHLMVGHELLKAHQAALGLPHFGHPVKEIYQDITEYLQQHKFPAFDKQLVQLEAAATAAPDSPDTEAKYQAVIATVHKARELAPADLRASLPEMIKVCASTIDAASGEYNDSLEQGKVAVLVEYHDSRGYLEYVAQQIADLKAAHSDPQSQAMIDRFNAVLAKAQWIVGELIPAPAPRATVEAYRAIATEARNVAP